MNVCRSCSDTSDILPLCPPQRLFLKPIARLNVSVQLPQLKAPNKSISSWEVMEKLRKMVKPEKFSILKVTKSTLEFIRFEAEVDAKSALPELLAKLDNKSIKLSGFTELLKVRAAEAKIPFPTRHVWDSFFREAKHMNEMKPGERPDTLHISNIPCKWFTLPEYQDKEPKPSEYIFRKVFETYGEVRYVDVPCTDPYRSRMNCKDVDIKTFSFDEEHVFEGFIQYKEYVSFLKAMNALKGMLLLYKESADKAYTANIKVDFDRTKHMTDHTIRRRHVERERLIQQDAQFLEQERKSKEAVEAKKLEAKKKEEEERLKLLQKKEKKNEKKKKVALLQAEDAEKERKRVKRRLAREERKLQEAHHKLENIHLLDMLLEKAKVKQLLKKKVKDPKIKKKKKKIPSELVVTQVLEEDETDRELLLNREQELRERLLHKYKEALSKQLAEEDELGAVEPNCKENGISTVTLETEISNIDSTDYNKEKPEILPDDIKESGKVEVVGEFETCIKMNEKIDCITKEEAVPGPSASESAELTTTEAKESNHVLESKNLAPALESEGEVNSPVEHESEPKSSKDEESPGLEISASDASMDTSASSSSEGEVLSVSTKESSSSDEEVEVPQKKEKRFKKEKKRKHKAKKSKKKKNKKEKKKKKKSKKRRSSTERSSSDDEPVQEAQRPHQHISSHINVPWRGRGNQWRGRFPRQQYMGRGRGAVHHPQPQPPWFEGQEFYDVRFIPPPWNYPMSGAPGMPFFPPRGFRRPNMRRPFFRHPGQPPPGYYDENLYETYEKYFLKFAHKNDKDNYSDRSRSRSSSRDRSRSRSRGRHSRSRRSYSRSRSRSNDRRSHSRSRNRDSRSRSRSRDRRSRSRSRDRRSRSSSRDRRSRSRSNIRSRSRSKSRTSNRSRDRRSRSRSKDRSRSRSKDRSRSRSKDRSRSKSKDRLRSRSKDRSRSKSKDRSRSKSKDRSRSKSKDKSSSKSKVKSRSNSKDRSRSRSKDRSRNKSKDRSRSRSRVSSRSNSKDRSRDRNSDGHKNETQQ